VKGDNFKFVASQTVAQLPGRVRKDGLNQSRGRFDRFLTVVPDSVSSPFGCSTDASCDGYAETKNSGSRQKDSATKGRWPYISGKRELGDFRPGGPTSSLGVVPDFRPGGVSKISGGTNEFSSVS